MGSDIVGASSKLTRHLLVLLAMVGLTMATLVAPASVAAAPAEQPPSPGSVETYGDDAVPLPEPDGVTTLADPLKYQRTNGKGVYDVLVVAVTTNNVKSEATAANSAATIAAADAHWGYATRGAYRLDYRSFVEWKYPGANACDLFSLADASEATVRGATANLTPRPGRTGVLVVYSLPAASNCGLGLGSLGGILQYVTGDWTTSVGAEAVAHEAGHNFTLGHSNALMCTDAPNFSDNPVHHEPNWPCDTWEYYDFGAIMGAAVDSWEAAPLRRVPFNQLARLGLIDASALVDLGQGGGKVVINPIDSAGSGARGIRLQVPGTSAAAGSQPALSSITLEYRTDRRSAPSPGVILTADAQGEAETFGVQSWAYVGGWYWDRDIGLKSNTRITLADGRQVIIGNLGATATVTVSGPPGAPSIAAAEGTAGGAHITIGAPAVTGSSPITSYQYSLNGGAWNTCVPASPALSCTIGNLKDSTTYRVRIRAVNSVGAGAASAQVAVTAGPVVLPDGAVYVPLSSPVRVADTRTMPQGPLGSGGAAGRVFAVDRAPGGPQVVPADATAVAYNVTAVTPQSSGHLRIMPGDADSTDASALNFRAGESIANAAVVSVPSPASVRVENRSSALVDVVLDVTGYFIPANSAAPTPTGRFNALAQPTRVFDNADNLLPAKADALISVAGGVGANVAVPAGASAVAYTITVVGPEAAGHLRVMPGNQGSTPTSTINWSAAGERIANSAIVGLDQNRQIRVYNGGSTPVRFLIDVAGYFAADGAQFYPVKPVRVYDSRVPSAGALTAREARTLTTAVGAGTPEVAVVPAGATGVAYNLAVVGSNGSGHFRLYPGGGSLPNASVLNWPGSGYNRANAGFVGVSPSRTVTVYNGGGNTDTVLDVTGYFK